MCVRVGVRVCVAVWVRVGIRVRVAVGMCVARAGRDRDANALAVSLPPPSVVAGGQAEFTGGMATPRSVVNGAAVNSRARTRVVT